MTATPTLLDRVRPLARIDALLTDAVAGRGGVLVVEGEPGIGKTALLADAAERGAGRGLAVLRARAGELERAYPYGVVRQLFAGVLAAAGPARRDELLSGAAGLAAAVLDPAVDHGPESAMAGRHGGLADSDETYGYRRVLEAYHAAQACSAASTETASRMNSRIGSDLVSPLRVTRAVGAMPHAGTVPPGIVEGSTCVASGRVCHRRECAGDLVEGDGVGVNDGTYVGRAAATPIWTSSCVGGRSAESDRYARFAIA